MADGYDDSLLDNGKSMTSTLDDAQPGCEDSGSFRLVSCMSPVFHGHLPCVQPLDALSLTTIVAPRDAQRIARRYAARARANLALSTCGHFHHHHHASSSATSGREKSRLHIGYLSANFGNHAIGHLLGPLLKYHDRSRFFVTCYSLTPSDGSSLRSNLEHGVEGSIKDLSSFSSSDAARLIHADGVHILAHLDGHTANARNEILALRPAPIQVGFILGFPGTFGADYIDYLVLDRIVLGPLEPARKAGTSHDIDECALILPNSCILNCHALEYDDLFENPGARPGRSKYGLPEDAFIFAYFGQLNKVDPIAYGVWMSILKRVPNSILLLIKSPESAVVHLKKAARDLQVHEQRLIFMDSAPKREHILRGVLADLLLGAVALLGLQQGTLYGLAHQWSPSSETPLPHAPQLVCARRSGVQILLLQPLMNTRTSLFLSLSMLTSTGTSVKSSSMLAEDQYTHHYMTARLHSNISKLASRRFGVKS